MLGQVSEPKSLPAIFREYGVSLLVQPKKDREISGLDGSLAEYLREAEAPAPYRIRGAIINFSRIINTDEVDWIVDYQHSMEGESRQTRPRDFNIRRPTVWETVALARRYEGTPPEMPQCGDEVTRTSESELVGAYPFGISSPCLVTVEGKEQRLSLWVDFHVESQKIFRWVDLVTTRGYDGRPSEFHPEGGQGGILFVENVPPGTTPL